jgi:hypothetical protein
MKSKIIPTYDCESKPLNDLKRNDFGRFSNNNKCSSIQHSSEGGLNSLKKVADVSRLCSKDLSVSIR